MLQQRQLLQLDASQKKQLISRKWWESPAAPRTAPSVQGRSSLRPLTSGVPASHPVTCSQCKYEHDAAAAAATPGVYIRCRTRLSLHPYSSSSLFLLLHAFVPNPSTLHPPPCSAEQQQQRCELTGADSPAHQLPQHAGGVKRLGWSPPASLLTSSLSPLGRKEESDS